MSSRNEIKGDYFKDGLGYTECANLCRERDDCGAFDVYPGTVDCQLFYDIDHFGDKS